MSPISPQSIAHLRGVDPKLAGLMESIGQIEWTIEDDYFQSLCRSIVGQQLSPKAAGTIFSRVKDLCGQVSVTSMTRIPDESLRAAGVSGPKIKYIRSLCDAVTSESLRLSSLDALSDHEVVQQLVQVNGIGRWTAEMFLIFSLGRPNVLSFGDLGLQRAIMWLYAVEKQALKQWMHHLAERWSPFCSVASLYLWRAIDVGTLEKTS